MGFLLGYVSGIFTGAAGTIVVVLTESLTVMVLAGLSIMGSVFILFVVALSMKKAIAEAVDHEETPRKAA